jgi:NHL repeat
MSTRPPINLGNAYNPLQNLINQITQEFSNGLLITDGPIYIADDGVNSIFVVPNNPINPAGSSQYPPTTSSSDPFQSVVDVFYDNANGAIYTLDTQFCQALKWNQVSDITNGTAPTPVFGTGTAGSGSNSLANPLKVLVDTSGNIYIADTGNNRIQVFNSSTGQWNQLYGPPGSGKNYFNAPCGMALTTQALIVADTNNGRLVQITNALSGATVAADWLSYSGPKSGPFKYPGSVTIGSQGAIYVFDWGAPYPGGVASTGERLISLADMSGTDWQVNSSVNNLAPKGGQILGRIWAGMSGIYLTQGPNLYFFNSFSQQNPAQYAIPNAATLVGLCVPLVAHLWHRLPA